MKKIKLLFTIWTYSWGGGTENILTNLVNHLDPNKYEIDILEYFHFDVKKEKVNNNINILPPIIDNAKASKLEKLYKILLVKYNPKILRRKYISKEYDYEIAFTKMIPSFLLDYNKKTIIWLHGEINEKTDRKRDIKLQEEYFQKCDRVIMISKYNRKLLLAKFPYLQDKSHLVYNSFDFTLLDKKASSEVVEKSDVPILLFLGRLDEKKNPLDLLKVAKILKNRSIKFKLQYIGQGVLEKALKEKVIDMELEECVEILPFKENPYPYIKNSTLLVQMSKLEGFPTVLAECTYLGKPFVCTKVGGSDELSNNNQCGYVIENNNIEAFADKVESLLTDQSLYNKFSNNGRENVKRFTIERQIKAFEEVLEDIGDE